MAVKFTEVNCCLLLVICYLVARFPVFQCFCLITGKVPGLNEKLLHKVFQKCNKILL